MNIYIPVIIGTFFMFVIYKKSGHFFKSLFTGAGGGIGAICAIGAASQFIPLTVGINYFTIAFCSVFSVPGGIFLLLFKTFIVQ